MKSLLPISLVTLAIASCQSPQAESDAKALSELSNKIDAIDKKIDRIGASAGRGQAPKQRRRPTVGQLYKIPVSDKDAYRGGKNAKVTIAIASEFACPYCAQLAKVSDELLEAYDDGDLKVVSKHFVVHPALATKPALATCAAALQGKFADFEGALWAKAWPGEKPRLQRDALSEKSLEKMATEIGLDMTRYKSDMKSACTGTLDRNRIELSSLGVNGTPAMYINGVYYGGARTVEALKAVIDTEVAKADKVLATGIALADYYPSLIAKGKTKM
ncbi:MAG: thioredoxin domain-containing protein [Kofleriaceae bacterium]|nr:thioredoxin domain-containing protein [Kofleriaceae bacterium]